jgi:hypothetical protein
MLIEVRGDLSVGVRALGLTMVALVVVEIWGEVFPLWQIWCRSQWGEWYGVPGGPTGSGFSMNLAVAERGNGLIVKSWSRCRTKFASPIIALPGACGRIPREADVPVVMFAALVYPVSTQLPHVLRKLKPRNDIRLFPDRNTMSAFVTPYRCPTLRLFPEGLLPSNPVLYIRQLRSHLVLRIWCHMVQAFRRYCEILPYVPLLPRSLPMSLIQISMVFV